MTEIWEEEFNQKQEMWGMAPAKSTLLTKDFFVEKSIKDILIPGIGYGRNAKPFIESEISVTGIEISKTAIEMARNNLGSEMTIYHGTVTKMPFEDKKYNGIFCYALIHLLTKEERAKLVSDCYNQLTKNGYMVFTAITKKAINFGKGKRISKDRYEFHKGAKIYYNDKESVITEFNKFGLFEITEVKETQPMYLIKCKKQ